MAIAWCTQRRLRIQYQSLSSDECKEWYLDPYFVETTGTGFSMYVIGQASRGDRQGIVTFKMNRIREIKVLDDTFEIPPDLDLNRLLSTSWGVMRGEQVKVKLKFSAEVARRVKESIWHHSQVIKYLTDGGCLMSLTVSITLEITPWIRGWGPDVEVLEPEKLRCEFTEYANRLHRTYCGP